MSFFNSPDFFGEVGAINFDGKSNLILLEKIESTHAQRHRIRSDK